MKTVLILHAMRRNFIKRCLWLLFTVIVLLNTIAFFHAYKFTHFDSSATKTKDAIRLSFGQKLSTALFGVNNPRPYNKATPAGVFETVKIKSNKEIACWLIKVPASKGTIILFHGYGGEKSSMLDKAVLFQRLGYSTLLVDFMGSGGSAGDQTTIGFKEAEEVKSSYDFLKNIGEKNIILFGTSMGSVAIMKALNDYNLSVRAIIIEYPFSTMLQTVKNRFATMGIPSFPMAYLLVFWGGLQNGFDAFSHNPMTYAKNIKCPTLLLYGAKDLKVSRQETMDIFNQIAGPKKLVIFPKAGHENYLTKHKLDWLNAVTSFLKQTQSYSTTQNCLLENPVTSLSAIDK